MSIRRPTSVGEILYVCESDRMVAVIALRRIDNDELEWFEVGISPYEPEADATATEVCVTCGSVNTVNYWKTPASLTDPDAPNRRVFPEFRGTLKAIYPDATACVDCGHVMPMRRQPRVDFSAITKGSTGG